MDLILEFLLDLLLEGSVGAISEKRVPLPIRIVAAIILVVAYVGLIVFITYTAISDESWYLLLVSLVLLVMGGFFTWRCVRQLRAGR